MRVQTTQHEGVPSDTHLVLLCLDYLMDLRRKNDDDVLNCEKHLDADYISLAVFALMRSIRRPDYLANKSREQFFDPSIFPKITDDVLLSAPSTYPRPYDIGYNDQHPSNLYRFFKLNGLAGGPENGPMILHDLVEAGLQATGSRCRLEAEKDIVSSRQFELYIQSVTNRGFFQDPANSGRRKDPKEEEERRIRKAEVYKEKYRKAIAKYREKLAVNVNLDATDAPMLSPPNSPPTKVNRVSRDFSSPPRTCQLPKEGPLSPLTPSTVEQEHSFASKPPKSPQTPRKIGPKKTLSFSASKSSTASPPTRSLSSAPVKSVTLTPVRSNSIQPSRSSSSTPNKTPIRSSSSSIGRTASRADSVRSTTPEKKDEESPRSSLAKMARRKGPKAPRESPLDTERSPGSSKITQKKIDTKKSPVVQPESYDPSGFSPIHSPEHAKPLEASPKARRCISPEIEVKVKAFSLYELNLVSSASSGLEANAGSFSVASPTTRRRKSEYEKKIEEQKQWKCPASLALPDISDPPSAEKKPFRKGRPQSINTWSGQDMRKEPKTPRNVVATSKQQVKPEPNPSNGAVSHPRSPIARLRRERYEEIKKQEEENISPRRFAGLKKVGSNEDSSWISGMQSRSLKTTTQQEEKPVKPVKEINSAFKKKASAFQSSGKVQPKRMPGNSPKAELKLDPFRHINPPKFMGSSRLFAQTVGFDKDEGLSSPRALTSPRGPRSSPRNFNSAIPIKRAC